ncbi:amine oxidase [Dictyocaulus viviparus]|uniref:Amine oxidase n=1 Tax=Dictyocaulus viviparus TaxID=29172 RepID=A0A0D8XIM0_DICVI|nr:amine oxidase [Dictyocaulus viviparus]
MIYFSSVETFIVLFILSVHFALPESSNDDIFDVIVIGAGLTGLSAARELKQRSPDARVKLIEARNTVGGRIRARTMKTADGDDLVDTGSHFISPSSTALTSLASQLGYSLFVQANCGTRTLHLRGIRSKRLSESLDIRQSFRNVLDSPDLKSLCSQSVREFAFDKHLSKITIDTANRLLQTLFDSPDVSTSIVHLLLASASENATIADLLLRFGHGQGLLVKEGLYRMTKALANNFDIQLNEIVTDINEVGSFIKVKTTLQYYTARHVIVTVPPAVTPSIRFSPSLPIEFLKFVENYAPTGHAYYFTLTYMNPFWRGQGRNGQLIYTNVLGPIVWLTTFDVGASTICEHSRVTGILWGIAHFSQQMTASQRYAAYVDIVTRSLGDYGQLPLDISDEHFVSDPFSRGSIAMLPPKVDANDLRYIQGVNFHGKGIVFASAEYSNISMGLMNGAVLSGQLAGASVAKRLRKSIEDQIDTDNEIADTIRLSDDVGRAFTHSASSLFEYQTSTQYPSTSSMETTTFKHFSFGNINDEIRQNEAEEHIQSNMDVEPMTVKSSFIYNTSSQYPSTKTLETTTFKHFSFGNANQLKKFALSSFLLDPPRDQISATTSITETTSTSADHYRNTTPFEYYTSSINSIPPTIEQTTFKHFSFQDLERISTTLSYHQDAKFDGNIDQNIFNQLKDVVHTVGDENQQNSIGYRAFVNPKKSLDVDAGNTMMYTSKVTTPFFQHKRVLLGVVRGVIYYVYRNTGMYRPVIPKFLRLHSQLFDVILQYARVFRNL